MDALEGNAGPRLITRLRFMSHEVTTAKLSSLINASPPVCVALTTKGRAPRSLGKGPMRALTLP